MLRQRVITAVVLLLILVASLMAPGHSPFALFTLVLIAAAAWEWCRLNQASPAMALGLAALLAVVSAVALLMAWPESGLAPAWWLAAAIWFGGGFIALRGGPAAWPSMPQAARLCIGLTGLWVAWLAVAHARVVGINFMLSVFCVVWMADIAAYFGGRAFGKRKLAPSISPGKSWAGVWSGMAGVLLLAVSWVFVDRVNAFDSPSLFTRLLEQLGAFGAGVALIVLSAMSVVGDLVESLVKRAAGAKDSSRLLPGHGGVLDRIDALLPVFPIALAFAWI